jgi:hypothetical protein
LQEANEQFDTATKSFENLTQSAREADVGDFAYFGIRGMVAIMKAPLTLITVVRSGVESVSDLFSLWVPVIFIKAVAAIMGIILLFAAIKFLTSRGQEP